MNDFMLLAQAAVGGLCAGGGVWAAIRVEIRLLWRENERHDKRINKIEDKINQAIPFNVSS